MLKEHDALKEVAIKILTNMGYTSNEIKQEYWVQPQQNHLGQNNSLHGFRVDVVGIKPDKKIAIECGNTPGEKIAALKMFFDEVIVLPYFSLNVDKLDLERVIREKNEIIQERDKKIQNLEQEVSDRHDLQRTIQEITRAWMEIVHRIASPHTYFFYDFSNKTDTDIMEALTKEVAMLKAKISAREEKERLAYQSPTTLLPLPPGDLT